MANISINLQGNDMTKAEQALIDEIADQIHYWVSVGTKAVTDPGDDLVWTKKAKALQELRGILAVSPRADNLIRDLLREVLMGFAHSLLVGFDGGSKLADEVRLTIVDDRNAPLCRYQHELLAEKMLESDQ